MVAVILQQIAKYQIEGSNWRLDELLGLDIHIDRYKPLRGSSHIEVPVSLKAKRAIINVKNDNDDASNGLLHWRCIQQFNNLIEKPST